MADRSHGGSSGAAGTGKATARRQSVALSSSKALGGVSEGGGRTGGAGGGELHGAWATRENQKDYSVTEGLANMLRYMRRESDRN